MKEVICPYCGERLNIERETRLVYCTCCSKEFNVIDAENYFKLRIKNE